MACSVERLRPHEHRGWLKGRWEWDGWDPQLGATVGWRNWKEGMDVGTQGGHSEDIMPGISFFSRTAKRDPRERCALLPFLSSNRLFLMQAWIYTQHKMKTGKTNLCPSQWTGLIHFGGGEVKSLHHFWGPPKYKCNTAVGAPRALLGGHTSMSPEAPDLPVNLRLTSDVHLGKLVYHGRMEAAPGWEPGPAFLWDLCPELWFSNRIHRRPLLILYLNYPQ